MYRLTSLILGLSTTMLLLGSHNPVMAQVTDDGTAGTIVTDVGFYTSITGGTQELTTLFHSFDNFSPGTIPIVFELNGSQSNVDLVLSRVTGNNPSLINALLAVSGGNAPDLFLINPNGVAFGANAFLDIPGSLMVSTADRVLFAADQSFSSRTPSAPPQLTISTPIGLQFGASAAPITVEGSFLDVSAGKSLGFFGGNVHLSGASVIAPGGYLSIGSVVPNSQITITENTLLADYANVTDFQNILFNQGTIVDVSGDGGGRFQLQGSVISLEEGTLLFASNDGATNGETISIYGSNQVVIAGPTDISAPETAIFAGASSTGRGNSLLIETEQLIVSERVNVGTLTSDGTVASRGGDITINAADIQLFSSTEQLRLTAQTDGAGQGGNLTITADVLTVDNTWLSTNSLDAGTGGNLTIQSGIVNLNHEAWLSADALGTGQGGDLSITADRLTTDNALLATVTFEEGRGGNLTIQGGTINLTNETALFADTFGAGQGGNLTIQGDIINLTNETQLSADTVGTGQGGNLTITADQLTADNALLATVTFEEGRGGNLTIQGGTINLTNETRLLADTIGSGQGGNLILQADIVNLTNEVQLSADTVGTGQGGNLTITADQLTADNALLATVTFEKGHGGNLIIQGNTVNLTNETRLLTDTVGSGRGGNLTLQADIVNLTNEVQLSADTVGTGQGGNLTITADQLTADNALLATTTFEKGTGGNLTLQGNTVDLKNETQLFVQALGTGQGGNLAITTDVLTTDKALLSTATLGEGDAGNLMIIADVLNADNTELSTSTLDEGNAGNLTLQGRNINLNKAQAVSSTAGNGDGGELRVTATDAITITGNGSLGGEILSSGLLAAAEEGSTGAAGNVYITSPSLSIRDGGTVSVSTSGSGDAGDIVIRADEIEVAEPIFFLDAISGIVALVLPEASGQGGFIDIEAERLRVFNGGQIAAYTQGSGAAGTINIQADDINVSGTSAILSLPSAIAASSFTTATAGSVTLNGDVISIQNGAEVSVSSNGGAGNINLSSSTLYLNDGNILGNVTTGTGGNINLSAHHILLMRNRSLISTNAADSATGGNILLSAPAIVGIENSDITANAIFGAGGNINITTDALIGLEFRNQLTPLNDITASSQFGISGNVAINNLTTNPASALTPLPENLVNAKDQVAQQCTAQTGSFTVTGRGGLPPNPTHNLNYHSLWHDLRDLRGNGTANITSDSTLMTDNGHSQQEHLAEAIAWHTNSAGQVELTTVSSTHANLQTHTTCSNMNSISEPGAD